MSFALASNKISDEEWLWIQIFEKIEHIIVLMLENRSFDNMLGWLGTTNGEKQRVNGVAGKGLSNPIPPYADNPKGKKSVPVGKCSVMTNPNPDPGEEYYHVNTQHW